MLTFTLFFLFRKTFCWEKKITFYHETLCWNIKDFSFKYQLGNSCFAMILKKWYLPSKFNLHNVLHYFKCYCRVVKALSDVCYHNFSLPFLKSTSMIQVLLLIWLFISNYCFNCLKFEVIKIDVISFFNFSDELCYILWSYPWANIWSCPVNITAVRFFIFNIILISYIIKFRWDKKIFTENALYNVL